MADAPDMSMVAYCGLCCDLCAERCRIPKQAAQLKNSMATEGWEFFGAEAHEEFADFWTLLGRIAGGGCRGCRAGGGFPGCEIRKCAKNRGVSTCADCAEYPCERVAGVGRTYPTLLADNVRMKEVGVEKWLAEQRERAATGFAYCDIRIRRQQT
jgi:hypothetical protein